MIFSKKAKSISEVENPLIEPCDDGQELYDTVLRNWKKYNWVLKNSSSYSAYLLNGEQPIEIRVSCCYFEIYYDIFVMCSGNYDKDSKLYNLIRQQKLTEIKEQLDLKR